MVTGPGTAPEEMAKQLQRIEDLAERISQAQSAAPSKPCANHKLGESTCSMEHDAWGNPAPTGPFLTNGQSSASVRIRCPAPEASRPFGTTPSRCKTLPASV